MYDIIIIGGGCAGLTAGIYAARYNLKVLVISREIGGALNEAHKVCNYPGYKDISGLELMVKFREQAHALGVEFVDEEVQKAENKGDHFFVATGSKQFEGKTIILAMGLKRRHMNIKGENSYIGKGVSYCYTCDAAFFKGKTVAVVGGSDSAALAAQLLSQYCKQVYIIYRKAELRCEPINLKAVEELKNVEVITETNVTELKGDNMLTTAVLDKPYKSKDELKIDGLFVEIGSVPSTVLAEQLMVERTESGMIIVDKDKRTNIDGVFAAGDITNTVMRQVVTAASDGAIAAQTAYQHIKKKKVEKY